MDIDIEPGTTRSLERLRRTAEVMERRYGPLPLAANAAFLDQRIAVKRRRIAYLTEEVDRLTTELRSLRTEIVGYEKGIIAALTEAIDRAREEYGEGWSFQKITGWRIWLLDGDDGRLEGATRYRWASPIQDAVCGRDPTDDLDVPHSRGPCLHRGHGCGIYVVKDPSILEPELIDLIEYAVGVVALSGKVVEHEFGYRGAHAEVEALAVLDHDHASWTNDRRLIADAFSRGTRRRPRGEWFDFTDTPHHPFEDWTHRP